MLLKLNVSSSQLEILNEIYLYKAVSWLVGRMEEWVLWDEGGGDEGQAQTMELNSLNLVKIKNCLLTLFLVGLHFINHGLACVGCSGEQGPAQCFPWAVASQQDGGSGASLGWHHWPGWGRGPFVSVQSEMSPENCPVRKRRCFSLGRKVWHASEK